MVVHLCQQEPVPGLKFSLVPQLRRLFPPGTAPGDVLDDISDNKAVKPIPSTLYPAFTRIDINSVRLAKILDKIDPDNDSIRPPGAFASLFNSSTELLRRLDKLVPRITHVATRHEKALLSPDSDEESKQQARAELHDLCYLLDARENMIFERLYQLAILVAKRSESPSETGGANKNTGAGKAAGGGVEVASQTYQARKLFADYSLYFWGSTLVAYPLVVPAVDGLEGIMHGGRDSTVGFESKLCFLGWEIPINIKLVKVASLTSQKLDDNPTMKQDQEHALQKIFWTACNNTRSLFGAERVAADLPQSSGSPTRKSKPPSTLRLLQPSPMLPPIDPSRRIPSLNSPLPFRAPKLSPSANAETAKNIQLEEGVGSQSFHGHGPQHISTLGGPTAPGMVSGTDATITSTSSFPQRMPSPPSNYTTATTQNHGLQFPNRLAVNSPSVAIQQQGPPLDHLTFPPIQAQPVYQDSVRAASNDRGTWPAIPYYRVTALAQASAHQQMARRPGRHNAHVVHQQYQSTPAGRRSLRQILPKPCRSLRPPDISAANQHLAAAAGRRPLRQILPRTTGDSRRYGGAFSHLRSSTTSASSLLSSSSSSSRGEGDTEGHVGGGDATMPSLTYHQCYPREGDEGGASPGHAIGREDGDSSEAAAAAPQGIKREPDDM